VDKEYLLVVKYSTGNLITGNKGNGDDVKRKTEFLKESAGGTKKS